MKLRFYTAVLVLLAAWLAGCCLVAAAPAEQTPLHDDRETIANLWVRPADALHMHADGELDLAVLSLVLHHLPEPGKALAEAARALAPGGRVLVVDMQPHAREEYRQEMGHVWLGFPPERLAGWLEAAGFEAVRVVALPVDVGAQGPALQTAVGRKPTG